MRFAAQFYEGVVTDQAPDDQMPGYIRVKIPELYGEIEVPFLVGPVYPGLSAGGWHSIPRVSLPSSDSEDEVRVMIVQIAPNAFRYIGTTQGWSEIEDSPGDVAGVRSPGGAHSILIDDAGVRVSAFDSESRISVITGEIRISSPTIRLTTSVEGITPTQPVILGRTFLTGLQTFLQGCVADAAMSPGTAAAAAVWLSSVVTSLSADAPYLSSVVEIE